MQTAIVTATIERKDGSVFYKTYRSDRHSITQLKNWIRRHWLDQHDIAYVACGNGIYQNSYGAH